MPEKKPAEKLDTRTRKAVPEDGIGTRIRDARDAREWTQAVLANRTKISDPNGEGVSRTVLVGYESGKYKPGAREIRLLAETLNVTPNWLLYGTEKPFRATLPSLAFLQGDNELEKSLRIALAINLLKSHERELIASMIFSLAGRELGDVQLSGLMMMAREFCKELTSHLTEALGTTSVDEAIRKIYEGSGSNWGTKLRLHEDGDKMYGEFIYPEPPKPSQ